MSTAVNNDAFRDWMAPKVAAIRELTAAIEGVAERHSALPNPNSRAMGDISDEQNYRSRSSWEQPVADAHAFGAMTLRAATDYVRGFAELFDSQQPPIYAHLAVARSALESAVVSWWLSDPSISLLERMKRTLCELLYSAAEVNELFGDKAARLGITDSEARIRQWKSVAESFGWSVNLSRTRPIIDGTKRPRVSDGIVTVSRSGADSEIGNLLFSRLSAVTHVTWFGLQSAIDFVGVGPDDRSGLTTVPIGTDGSQVSAVAFYVVRLLRNAADTRFTYMGWSDEPWQAAVRAAGAIEDIFAQTVLNATKQT
jgi:hypothetical protein